MIFVFYVNIFFVFCSFYWFGVSAVCLGPLCADTWDVTTKFSLCSGYRSPNLLEMIKNLNEPYIHMVKIDSNWGRKINSLSFL